MTKILQNLESVEKGEKKFAPPGSNDIRRILESFNNVEEAPMPAPVPQPPQGQPVSMNVSLNASGKDHVDDLIALMQNAGLSDAGRADSILDVDIDGDNQPDIALQSKEEDADFEEEYANEPDEEYQDTEFMTRDLSGGLNREKKSYPKASGGDNPMALEASIKEMLYRALEEKKKPDENNNGIPDYAEDGEGPNDLAKGGKKPAAKKASDKKDGGMTDKQKKYFGKKK